MYSMLMCLKEYSLIVFAWPRQSSDLNPTDHLVAVH